MYKFLLFSGWAFLEGLFFYGTGHQPTFPSIQWSAAFVGFSGATYGSDSVLDYYLPAVLIGWNTFVSRITFGFLLPLLLLAPFSLHKLWLQDQVSNEDLEEALEEGEAVLVHEGHDASHMFRLCVKYSVILGLKMLASMLAAAHLRRHLMIWKIFAPRFIFEAIGFGVSLVVLSLSYLIYCRILGCVSRIVQDWSKDK